MKKMSTISARTGKTCFFVFGTAMLLAGWPALSADHTGKSYPSVRDSVPELNAIDQPVYEFMAKNNVPGISLAITKDEKLVYVKGYGFADKETHSRVTAASLFRIASISKPLTSITIMKLMEEKKLSLDDKIFGPQGILKTKYGKQPYKKEITEITVRQLLQHISGGWKNDGDDPMFTDPARSVSDLISFTLDTFPLKNKPGTHYAYSNFGYCVLGRVIEQVTGQPYAAYVKNVILAPMGITDMEVGGNTLAERKNNEVKYYGQEGEDPYIYNISRMDSHGGWIASATDLISILAHTDGSAKVKDILGTESVKTMLTAPAVSPNYACGWAVDTAGNWQHAGSLPGTTTELRHRTSGYAYALLLNTRSDDSLFNAGLRHLIATLQQVKAFPSAEVNAPTVSNYTAPVFTDKDRLSKLATVFPIVENMYKEYAKKNNIPGLAFGIVADGKLLYSQGIGYGDVAKKVPVTASSVYRIASMTKSFTAMAILLLRDAGKLSIDDPVSKFIPEIKNIQPLTGDSPPITIRNLLTHTAGFPEDNPWGDRQLQRTDEELIDFIRKGVSLSSTPGLNYEYSNLGFALLGHIVSAVSGEPFEQFINKNIFEPLGMKHTYWEYTDVPSQLLVHGYRWVNGGWKEEEMLHSGAYGAMGGLLTSVEDFSKYINFHLSAWPPRSDRDTGILKRSSLREMHLPANPVLHASARNSSGDLCPKETSYNFGLGWSEDCTGKRQIGHSGGLPGFGTHWAFLPEYGIGIVSFSNLTYAANSALDAAIADTLVALAGLQPRTLPASGILEQRKNELVKLLPGWKNARESGIFSENFFLDYFVDSLKKEAEALFKKAGKIIKTGEMIPDNQLRGNFIIEGEKMNILVRFTLSPENPALIQQYIIRESPKGGGKYGLKTVSDIDEYRQLARKNPDQELVALDKFIPGVKLDIRYATSGNLMKRPLYGMAAAYMRLPAAVALKKIQEELRPMGYGLKIYDGYRPYDVTVVFYEKFRDTAFVASPYTGSRHNRGCAVDLTLIDLKTGKELDMPTPYDSFTKQAHCSYPELSERVLKNRELLQTIMIKHDFMIYPDEWWHFDFAGWNKYPLMNIPFETLRPL